MRQPAALESSAEPLRDSEHTSVVGLSDTAWDQLREIKGVVARSVDHALLTRIMTPRGSSNRLPSR
jgi:hypothetical protein